MSYNFKRAYSLIIGERPKLSTAFDDLDQSSLTALYNDLTNRKFELNNLNIPNQALEISTLQFETRVSLSKDDKGQNQQATISVTNLDKETIDFISKKNSLLILKAGYENDNDLPIIYSGQVKAVDTVRRNSDLVTTITTSSGFTASTGVKISTSLINRPPENLLNYADVFNHLAEIWKNSGVAISKAHIVLGASSLPVIKPPEGVLIPNGWSYEGYLRDAMDDLCEHFNYTWYIQNNVLFIHPRSNPKFVNVFVLEESQIKDIRPLTTSTKTSVDEDETGLSITTFLNGFVEMGNKIRITQGEFKGDYNIKSVTHDLNFRGNQWDTRIEVEVIK